MITIRKEVHTRCAYANTCFEKYSGKLRDSLKSGSISGKNTGVYLHKLHQAHRIWLHYAKEFGDTVKKF